MWREIRLLAGSKPVVASMSDVAASGGYYMAMGAGTIVAENLTLTGSIGVVTGELDNNKFQWTSIILKLNETKVGRTQFWLHNEYTMDFIFWNSWLYSYEIFTEK